jgi:hypothetical protein
MNSLPGLDSRRASAVVLESRVSPYPSYHRGEHRGGAPADASDAAASPKLFLFLSTVSAAQHFTRGVPHQFARAQKTADRKMFLWSYPQFLDRRNDAGYIRGEG